MLYFGGVHRKTGGYSGRNAVLQLTTIKMRTTVPKTEHKMIADFLKAK